MNKLLPILLLLLLGPARSGAEGNPDASSAAPDPEPLVAVFSRAVSDLPAASGGNLAMPTDEMAADRARMEGLLREGTEWLSLDDGARAGLLVALADRTALDGDRAMARELYGALGRGGVALLRQWSGYMIAGLDFAAGSYADAAAGYEAVCGEDAPAEWRDHACSMAGLALRLAELESGGGGPDVRPGVHP